MLFVRECLWVQVLLKYDVPFQSYFYVSMFCKGAVTIAGVGYNSSLSIPRSVHNAFIGRLSMCELFTTFLVARWWQSHAKAMQAGHGPATTDPQMKGWAPSALGVLLVGFDLLAAIGILLQGTSPNQATNHIPYALLYTTLRFGGEICGLVFLAWSCGKVLLVTDSTVPTKRTRRVATYLALSCGFILLDLAVSVSGIVLRTSLLISWTPETYLMHNLLLSVGRIGTGLCQLSIFLPKQSRTNTIAPVTLPEMDSQFYKLETTRLQHSLQYERKKAAEEKGDLVRELRQNNEELETAQCLLKQRNSELVAALKKVEIDAAL